MITERDDLQARIRDLEEMVRRLSAQVAEHDALLARMCHGPIADFPRDARFPLNISGPDWDMVTTSSTAPNERIFWSIDRWAMRDPAHYGYAPNITAAMVAIRKALAESGATP